MTTKTVGATPKQLYWVQKCLEERVVPEALAARAVEPMSTKDASAVLTSLFACPKIQKQYEQTEPAEAGYYVLEETPYVVVESKKTGRRCAKRLVLPRYPGGRAKWVYAKGAVFKLAGMKPLTLAEASEFGHLHGYCVCCGTALDVPLSVAAGIGPTCVKKYFGMTQLQFLQTKGQVA